MALTIAYLAVEMLLLPEAGARWAVAGVLGLFHGLHFALFLRSIELPAALVMGGAMASEAIVLAALGFALGRLKLVAPPEWVVRVAAGLLLAVGLGWFWIRLRS